MELRGLEPLAWRANLPLSKLSYSPRKLVIRCVVYPCSLTVLRGRQPQADCALGADLAVEREEIAALQFMAVAAIVDLLRGLGQVLSATDHRGVGSVLHSRSGRSFEE